MSQFVSDAANWMVDSVNRRFPGRVLEFQFNAEVEPEFGDDVFLFYWVVTVHDDVYETKEIADYLAELSDRLFWAHGIFITFRIRRNDDDGSDVSASTT